MPETYLNDSDGDPIDLALALEALGGVREVNLSTSVSTEPQQIVHIVRLVDGEEVTTEPARADVLAAWATVKAAQQQLQTTEALAAQIAQIPVTRVMTDTTLQAEMAASVDSTPVLVDQYMQDAEIAALADHKLADPTSATAEDVAIAFNAFVDDVMALMVASRVLHERGALIDKLTQYGESPLLIAQLRLAAEAAQQ